MEAVGWLRESGVTATEDVGTGGHAHADAILGVSLAGQAARFAVETRGRAPYPNELDRLEPLRATLSQWGVPLLVVPYMREDVGNALSQAGWSWADGLGNFDLRAPGLLLRQRRSAKPARPVRRTLPGGPGSFAVMRELIGLETGAEDVSATTLAQQAKVSQPRASQVLRQLLDQQLVERAERGRWRPRREALLDRFLAEYPGPGGSENFFYTLDSPVEAAINAARILGDQVAISADVGPDYVVPWRRPSALIIYTERLVDPVSLSLVEAQGPHDANVIVRMPADTSVFGVQPLMTEGTNAELRLADPVQMIWDLLELGGADRAEAAGRLREWLLTSH
jgi:DNA-binding transcriptional ArsR family regulator